MSKLANKRPSNIGKAIFSSLIEFSSNINQNVVQKMCTSRIKTSKQNSMIDIDHSEGRITTKLMISKVKY